MIKMGNTYCDRFSSHFALKTIEKRFPNLFWGTLVGFVGLGSGANWVQQILPTGDCGKGELCV